LEKINVPGSWPPAETLAFLPSKVAEMHSSVGWAAAGGNGKKRSDPSSRGGSVPVSGPGECFHAEVPKGKQCRYCGHEFGRQQLLTTHKQSSFPLATWPLIIRV